MPVVNKERHRTGRIGWLRAAVLGANDGILSTSSLVLGVAAAQVTHSNVLVAGVAGLVAGAMSMAAAGRFRCTGKRPQPTRNRMRPPLGRVELAPKVVSKFAGVTSLAGTSPQPRLWLQMRKKLAP